MTWGCSKPLAQAEARTRERGDAAARRCIAAGRIAPTWVHWIDAERPVGDHVTALIEDGFIFDIGWDTYWIEERCPSPLGAQADLLVIGGVEWVDADYLSVTRNVQVCDLEDLIGLGLVQVGFGITAREPNPACDWGDVTDAEMAWMARR